MPVKEKDKNLQEELEFIKDKVFENNTLFKIFAIIFSVVAFLVLIFLILIFLTSKDINKKLDFLLRKQKEISTGIIIEKNRESIKVALYDPEKNKYLKTESFFYDEFSDVSIINLNYCYVWKEHRKEISKLAPSRPWYPTLLLYVLQFQSPSKTLYPPFPCDKQKISDKGVIFEEPGSFKKLKKSDYVIVKSNIKNSKLYISKIIKIEPTFLMPLLTDKQ